MREADIDALDIFKTDLESFKKKISDIGNTEDSTVEGFIETV